MDGASNATWIMIGAGRWCRRYTAGAMAFARRRWVIIPAHPSITLFQFVTKDRATRHREPCVWQDGEYRNGSRASGACAAQGAKMLILCSSAVIRSRRMLARRELQAVLRLRTSSNLLVLSDDILAILVFAVTVSRLLASLGNSQRAHHHCGAQ